MYITQLCLIINILPNRKAHNIKKGNKCIDITIFILAFHMYVHTK